jgi:hypothetical protein
MFTHGQVAKMRSLFDEGAPRASLMISDKAAGALTDDQLNIPPNALAGQILLYPNPAVNELNVGFNNEEDLNGKQIIIYNHLGQAAKQIAVTKRLMQVNVRDLTAGVYFISAGNKKAVKFVKAN